MNLVHTGLQTSGERMAVARVTRGSPVQSLPLWTSAGTVIETTIQQPSILPTSPSPQPSRAISSPSCRVIRGSRPMATHPASTSNERTTSTKSCAHTSCLAISSTSTSRWFNKRMVSNPAVSSSPCQASPGFQALLQSVAMITGTITTGRGYSHPDFGCNRCIILQ